MTRRFKTDYASAWCGHCKTRENAIIAAAKHLVRDGYTACTITDVETGRDVARLRLSADRKTATITTESQIRKVTL
jgi:hypothetical protein